MGGWGGLRQSNRWTGWGGWGDVRQSNRWTEWGGWGDERQSNRWTGGVGRIEREKRQSNKKNRR